MIRAIIFDCFGVLYADNTVLLQGATPTEYLPKLEDLRKANDYGFLERGEYLKEVADLTGSTAEEVDRLSRDGMQRNDALVSRMKSLKETYKLGLLSNVGYDFFYELFTHEEADELFTKTILSSDVHMIKPDPELFEYTAAQLGVNVDECVLIDDNLQNIEGARSTGMHAILFTSNQQSLAELDLLLHA